MAKQKDSGNRWVTAVEGTKRANERRLDVSVRQDGVISLCDVHTGSSYATESGVRFTQEYAGQSANLAEIHAMGKFLSSITPEQIAAAQLRAAQEHEAFLAKNGDPAEIVTVIHKVNGQSSTMTRRKYDALSTATKKLWVIAKPATTTPVEPPPVPTATATAIDPAMAAQFAAFMQFQQMMQAMQPKS